MDEFQNYLIKELPASAYYIPEFISEEQAQYLMQKIYASPKPKWTNLSHRRLQNWGGIPHPKGMIQEALPNWLEIQTQKLFQQGIFDKKRPNHVLVNEYQPGEGIMPHEDGPLFYPTIATINLGSHTFLDFYHRLADSSSREKDDDVAKTNLENRYFASLLLEPRSLLILKNDMYTNYLHGIQERTADLVDDRVANIQSCQAKLGNVLARGTRISLTIRHVPKVLKVKLFNKK